MTRKAPDRFPDAPGKIRALPLDPRGFPIPAFVGWLDGKRDFRVIMSETVERFARERLCWICGRKLGAMVNAFVVGPMCTVNRISSEPPSHLDCARFAVKACPFLTEPKAIRNERELAEHVDLTPGIPIARNPGASAIWICRRWRRGPEGLFHMGTPSAVEWYARGRPASRAEVMDSIDTGLPLLRELAVADGEEAVAMLEAMTALALEFVPA